MSVLPVSIHAQEAAEISLRAQYLGTRILYWTDTKKIWLVFASRVEAKSASVIETESGLELEKHAGITMRAFIAGSKLRDTSLAAKSS